MAQHFLHSRESRNFSRIARRVSEDEAEAWFAVARWGSSEKQGCPRCATFRRHYRRPARRWRCAECKHEFSVTSGTALHGHKLSFRDMIDMILAFENGSKGESLLEVSRRVGCTPKTAQVFFGKLRETLIHTMDLSPLSGIVHVDGGYFGGKPRKPNRKRKMPRDALKVRFGKKAPNDPTKPWIEAGMTYKNWCKRANKRVVISICESAGHRQGSRRVMAFVCRSENEADVQRISEHFIAKGSVVMTDESNAYTLLGAHHDHYTVSHAHEFSTSEGVSDNMCETFFSRVRRGEYGTLHGFRPKYLQDYAAEYVWRENFRRRGQADRFHSLLMNLQTARVSAWWCGYWQGRHRTEELGLDYFIARAA